MKSPFVRFGWLTNQLDFVSVGENDCSLVGESLQAEVRIS